MALEMDLAFYFHRGRHDLVQCMGKIWPQVRSTVFHSGRRVGGADIIKLLLLQNRET